MVGKCVFIGGFSIGKTAGNLKAQLAPREQPGDSVANLGFIVDNDDLIHTK